MDADEPHFGHSDPLGVVLNYGFAALIYLLIAQLVTRTLDHP